MQFNQNPRNVFLWNLAIDSKMHMKEQRARIAKKLAGKKGRYLHCQILRLIIKLRRLITIVCGNDSEET